MTALSFQFATAGRIVFGAGTAGELPALVQPLGSRAMIFTGSRPERHRALLSEIPLPCKTFGVTGEPTVDAVRLACEAARQFGADVVVGIGGGSALDLGKAVAMLLGNGGDPLDYLEVVGRGQPIRAPSVPMVAVPTTSGSGAEVTANAVIASPEHQRKASLRSPSMLPTVALVDPELALGCPPDVTASSGLDALTQCLEPYVSPYSSPLTDGFAREGLRCVASGLPAVCADGSDRAGRQDMALGSLLGGLSLANAKLGVVHGFAGVIGGLVEAPHGALCAALLEPVTEVNVRALRERAPKSPALSRYREASSILTGRPDASVAHGVAWIRQTVAQVGVDGLRSYGLGAEHADHIVTEVASSSSTRGNPIELSSQELREAYERAL